MRGTILIEQLQLHCIIGILPAERVNPQPLLIEVAMEADFSEAAASESVTDTVDYAAVAARLQSLVHERQYQLVETLVAEAGAAILEWQPRVQQVTVTARKPNAVAEAGAVGARLTLTRND